VTVTPAYRLFVAAPRSQDPSEAFPLQPVAGAPHTDYCKVTTLPGGIPASAALTSGLLSQSGLGSFSAANCVNGNLADAAWDTDAAVSGAWLRVDLGAGVARRFQYARVRVQDGDAGTYAGIYDIEYSDNDAAWSKAFTSLRPQTPGTWASASWLDLGTHRYWRLLLMNTPGAGPELSEVEFWEFGGPGAWRPYLLFPESGRRGVIDLRDKGTDTGWMTFGLVDVALTPTDPLTRWLPSFLGNLKGQLRSGGLLVASQESLDGGATWTGFFVGRLRRLEQRSPVRYAVEVRERSDDFLALAFVGPPPADITYAGLTTVWPIGGATIPYGRRSARRPLTGTVRTRSVFTKGKLVSLDPESRGRLDNIVTRHLRDACPFWDDLAAAQEFSGTTRLHLKRVDTQAEGYFQAAFSLAPPWGANVGAAGSHYRIHEVGIGELDVADVGYMALPPDLTAVEIWLEDHGDISPSNPLLINDAPLLTLWQDLLAGKFGFRWMPPEQRPPGVAYGDPHLPMAYDAAAFAALATAGAPFPVLRFIIRDRAPRGDWIRANILKAGNVAYYLDGDGVVVPVDLRTPTDVTIVPTITDAHLLQAPPPWEHNRDRAITRVDTVYYTDLITLHLRDINDSSDMFPTGGLALEELRHAITLLDMGSPDLGDIPFDLDLPGFRTQDGEELNGQARQTVLERQLVDLATDTARPLGTGAPTLELQCQRGTPGDAGTGELRKLSIRSIPDPATNKLGGTRLVRVSARQERQNAVQLTVADLGLPTVAGTPTLGVPAQETGNTQHGVTVTVTLNAAGDPVQVQYAVTATSVGTAPVVGDPLWTPMPAGMIPGRSRLVTVTGDVSFRGLPAGQRIWVRGRSFPDVRVNYHLPSAWVAASSPGRVDLASLSVPTSPTSSLITARSFRVSWTNGSALLQTELLLATPTTDPRIVVARLGEGSTLYDFPGDTGVLIQPSTTYRVGVRHYDGPKSVSAEVTVDVTTTSTGPTIFPPIDPPGTWR
jgi:hypothetical protein